MQLFALTLLEEIMLGDNELTGTLPPIAGRQLRMINLKARLAPLTTTWLAVHVLVAAAQANYLSGPLPRQVAKLDKLEVLVRCLMWLGDENRVAFRT